MMLKAPVYRSSRWLAAVRSIESCVLCGRYGVQAAHRNEGKGMARKVDDCLTARCALIVTVKLIMGMASRAKNAGKKWMRRSSKLLLN